MYKPRFNISPELLRLITTATEIRAWIHSSVADAPWLSILQHETAVRLAHSSTAIESNPLSLPEVESLAHGEKIGAFFKDEQEVINALAAVQWVRGRKGKSIRESDILTLHRILTRKVLSDSESGYYKTRPNRIVDHRGIAVYTPPTPDKARQLTLELFEWINSKASEVLHPVILGAIAHHRLASIHPFADGNGRVSRTVGIWLFYTGGFDPNHIFAVDEFFEHDRRRYYEKMQQVRNNKDDLSCWLEYVAEGVVTTLNKAKDPIHQLNVSIKAPRMVLTGRQQDILMFLRDKGCAKSSDIEKAFSITRARVGQIIKPLIDAGLIIREGQTRATTYRLVRVQY